MKFNSSFGTWLRQRRKALDLTQTELADQVGYSVVTIRKIEHDVVRPSKQMTEQLADVLAIAAEDRASFIAFARHRGDPLSLPPAAVRPIGTIHNLPPQPTAFVGRGPELAQIQTLFEDAQCRLLTLVGPGGIGKTRLAVEAVQKQCTPFVDAAYFVSLASVSSPELLVSTIASALKLSLYGPEDPTTQLLDFLREKHLLLVLDSFEHLLEGTRLLARFLENCSHLRLLVTSRERLCIQEEWVLEVQGLLYPEGTVAENIEDYSAVQLFAQRARQCKPTFAVAENVPAVIEICRLVGGTPLAIELAATWLRIMSAHQIARQIAKGLDFLATTVRNVPDRHRSMRTVFDQSWVLLSDTEQGVLARLSVFRGGFDLESAEQVAGASLVLLSALVDKSLIRLSQGDRYDLHELLRQYASEKLIETGEVDVTARAHLEYFLDLATQAEAMLYTPDQVIWHDRLETNHDNLRSALGWALRGGDSIQGLRLAAALNWFWHMRLYHHEGRDWLEKLLAAAGDAPASVRAKALQAAGDLSGLLVDGARAVAHDEQALVLARSINDKQNMAWALCNLVSALRLTTIGTFDYPRAYSLYDEAIALFREVGDPWGLNHALARLGSCAGFFGRDYQRAAAALDECQSLAEKANATSAVAWALTLRAIIMMSRVGDLNQAIPLQRRALALFRELHFQEGIIDALVTLGNMLRMAGDCAQAQELFEESLDLSQYRGNTVGIALAHLGLAQVARSQGAYQPAHVLAEESLTTYARLGDKEWSGKCLAVLGGLALDEGRLDRAARLLSAAQALFDTIGFSPDWAVKSELDRDIGAVRAQLDPVTFAAAWAEGQAMTLEQAVAYMLEKADDSA